jgi:hypothetical protein
LCSARKFSVNKTAKTIKPRSIITIDISIALSPLRLISAINGICIKLSIAECALSYIDYCAAQENSLLIKELSVSLGAGSSVLIATGK